MVTLITNKLKKQSLEDLPNEPVKIGTNTAERKDFILHRDSLEGDFKQRVHNDRRQGPGHHRTRSYPTHNLRGSECKGTIFNSSTMHSSTLPPASKKLCRSISVPEEESSDANNLSCWVPKASKVWHPVKVYSKTGSRPRSMSSPPEQLLQTHARNSEETEISPNSTAVNSMSTPPASPTPRPASAFAALSQNLYSKTNAKEMDKATQCCKVENTTDECPRLKRSHSQPSFERARVCGIKRRIEDDFDRNSNLRPALDLAKMEESSYFRFRDKRRGLRIPKYSNKSEAKGLPAPYFTERESFILKPIVSSPLDATASSIMITPTSSPTRQLDLADKVTTEKTLIIAERKGRERRVFNLDYGLELDIASIEEDDLY